MHGDYFLHLLNAFMICYVGTGVFIKYTPLLFFKRYLNEEITNESIKGVRPADKTTQNHSVKFYEIYIKSCLANFILVSITPKNTIFSRLSD